MAIEEGKSLITLELDTSNEKYNALEHIENDLQPSVVRYEIVPAIADIDARIEEINAQVSELNIDIDRLTNHADAIDYAVAVASGVLTGLIDSFFVGEWNFKEAKAKSNRIVNDFIMDYAKGKGYKGDRLNGAISFLEDKYPVLQDNSWSGKGIGVSAKSHHLDDLAHHPTLLGLVSSVVVEFFRVGFFVNKDGEYHFTLIDTEPKDIIKAWLPVIISGLLLWAARIAENHYEDKMDEEFPKPIKNLITALAAAPLAIKLLKVSANWAGHLVSDMGGSKNTAGGGMGIPGLFLSLMKEISSIPGINLTPLPKLVNDWYTKDKVDMRTELAVGLELGRQAIPVIINEVLVRGFYFIRHLVVELKDKRDFKQVEWSKTIPFGNRTVERMMTIATGTFTAVDLADAAIRGAINSGGNWAGFAKNFILRVNFVGIGRFAIAIGVDVGMGIKKSKKEKERIVLNNEKLHLLNAKLFYKEEKVWEAAKDAQTSVNELFDAIETVTPDIVKTLGNIEESIVGIADLELNEDTLDLLADLLDIDEE